MKRALLNNALWASVLMLAFFAASCEDDDDEVTPESLSITFLNGADQTVNVGDIADMSVTVVAENRLEQLTITAPDGTVTTYDRSDLEDFGSNTEANVPYQYTVKASDSGQTLSFSFVLTDRDNNSTSATARITVPEAAIAITLTDGGGNAFESGSEWYEVDVDYEMVSTVALTSVRGFFVDDSGNEIADSEVFSVDASTINGSTYSGNLTSQSLRADAAALRFEATNEGNETSFADFAITDAYENTGQLIGNLDGPSGLQGAYNLVLNQPEDSGTAATPSDPDSRQSDMQHPGNDTNGDFIEGWDGENGTLFAVITNETYEDLTNELTAGAAYGAGGVNQVRDLEVGDVIVARLRGQEEYVVIEITAINSTNDDNLDTIEFKYKKGSETAGQ